jgi:hypothetical protein
MIRRPEVPPMRDAGRLGEMLVEWVRPHGPMLAVCTSPGCTTLTMGGTCVMHDPPVTATFERGRPYSADVAESSSPLVVPS